jgi:hypothetical protein
MPAYNLGNLKVQQERLDSQRDKLLDNFIQFREGMIEGLDFFAEHAAKIALRGVKHCEKKCDTHEFLEVAFTLKEFDWVLVATDTTLPSEYGGNLAAKMFIYLEGDAETPPLFEIIVDEAKEDYHYEVWYLEQGRKPVDYGTANKQGGQKAAATLIWYLYRFQSVWPGAPSLAMIRRQSVEKSRIGFLTQE